MNAIDLSILNFPKIFLLILKVNLQFMFGYKPGRNLTEAKDIKKRWQKYTEELCKKDLHDPDNQDGMFSHLEPDILECEVKWALGRITTNQTSGGDGIPVELLQILKDDAVKELNLICQQIWKTQQWPQDLKRSVFTLNNCTYLTH